MLKPLRNLMHIERVVREKTPGGIFIPQTFDHANRPSLKFGAMRDYFEAKVLAVGPEVRDVEPGDHVLVWTFADGDGRQLFTGEGDDNRLLVRYPDDLVCAVDVEAAS